MSTSWRHTRKGAKHVTVIIDLTPMPVSGSTETAFAAPDGPDGGTRKPAGCVGACA